MARLHFGIHEAPYEYGKARTTHEVAEILEARYHVIERFVADSAPDIRALILEQSARHAQQIMKGRKPQHKAMTDKIRLMFRSYILRRALDGHGTARFPIPTGASLRGVNHRLKHPYARRASRPSFFDTGLYVSSFRAWID